MKKKILATFLSAVTLVSCSSALAANYSDVNQSAWYSSREGIRFLNLMRFQDMRMVHSDRITKLHKKNL